MEAKRSSSYVSLKLSEIQKRFAELSDEDLAGLSLEEPEQKSTRCSDAYNPYNHS